MSDYLLLTPDNLAFAIFSPDRSIVMQIDMGRWAQFQERPVAVRMAPSEARQLAQRLIDMADKAEAGPRPR